MEALKTMGWWVLLLLAVGAIGWVLYSRRKNFNNRVDYSIDGKKGSLGFIKPEFWQKHWDKMLALLVVILVVVFVAGCSSSSDETPPVATVSALCPSVIQGSVDAPPMEDRVKALAIEAASKGIAITGNYAADVAAQGGEMMLIGTQFKFVFDAGCQVDKTQSSLNLFLTDYPVEGGIAADGSLGMAVDVGGAKVGVKGRVVNGQFIEGEVRKGWLPHIYGVLNGTFTPVGKI